VAKGIRGNDRGRKRRGIMTGNEAITRWVVGCNAQKTGSPGVVIAVVGDTKSGNLLGGRVIRNVPEA
jgi:hypothetical protein